jgi:hypothetical protein
MGAKINVTLKGVPQLPVQTSGPSAPHKKTIKNIPNNILLQD